MLRRFSRPLAALGLCAALLGPLAVAQVEKKEEKAGPADARFTNAFTVLYNREATRLIVAANDYVRKEQWDVVAKVLQDLLDAPQDSFVEVERKDPAGVSREKVKVSVRTEANRLLGELPPAGLETYEVLYGQAATARLKEALARNDAQLLAEVAQGYLHTKAGAEATALLGSYHLDRGRYLMAALCFDRLLGRRGGEKPNPALLFKAALAHKRAGDAAAGERYWKQLAAVARGEVALGKSKYGLDQLRREYDRDAGAAAAGPSDWPLVRGNPSRTAVAVGGTPFLEPRWTAGLFAAEDLPEDRTENKPGNDWIRQNLEVSLKTCEAKNIPPLPASYPLVAGDKLVYRTYEGVQATYLRDDPSQSPPVKAGELAWVHKTYGGLHSMVRTPANSNTVDAQWWSLYRQSGPYGALFENSLLGALAHDNQFVYAVDDLAIPPHPQQMVQFVPGGGQVGGTSVFADQYGCNRLVAVEIDSGKEVWSLGGKGKKDDPEGDFTDSFFLGAPLPLGGKLYCLVESRDGEMQLVCLDPFTREPGGNRPKPALVWKQPLGTATTRLPQDAVRRWQAAFLAYSDGILVCPTNAGEIIGVDLLTHSLVWSHSYREPNSPANAETPPPQQQRFNRFGRVQAFDPAVLSPDRWRPAPPAVAGGKVVFTAYDAASIQCLNLRDGRLLWHSPRGEDLYFGGLFDGQALVVGKDSCRLIDVAASAGRDVVARRVEKTGLPAGQGAASNGVYYLPVRASSAGREPEVVAIDLAEARVTAHTRSRKKEVPGNLAFFDGDVYSLTTHAVTAYPQLTVKLAEIDRRLKANPADPVGLTERGELRLDKGELGGAVDDLRAALAGGAGGDFRRKAREKLFEALTELLQQDFEAGERFIGEYRDLCKVEVPADADAAARERAEREELRRKSDYLCLVARGRQKQGKLVEAFQAYLDFGTLTGGMERVTSIDEPNTQVRPDVWARGRIASMFAAASPAQRKPLEERLAAEWGAVRDTPDLDRLRKFVNLFGPVPGVGGEARLHLAGRLLDAGDEESGREAQMLLLQLRGSPDDQRTAARAVERLARLMVRKGMLDDAVVFYRELGQSYGPVEVRDGKTGADFLDELLTDKRFLPYLEPLRQPWGGQFKGENVSQMPGTAGPSFVYALEPEGELLPFFRRHRVLLEAPSGSNWSLRVADRTTGQDARPAYRKLAPYQAVYQPGAANVRLARACGHVLVLNLGNKVSAFDLSQPELKELWSHDLMGKAGPPVGQGSTLPDANGLWHVTPDGSRQRVGQVGVIDAAYVCLLTRDGLVALDPVRGTPFWTRPDVTPRTQVFGDADHVFLVETDAAGQPVASRAVRACDGTTVAVPNFAPLYAAPRRQQVLGRHLLVLDGEPAGSRTLRLYDPLTGRDVWQREVPAGATLVRCEDHEQVGVVTSDGRLTVADARTGAELVRRRVEHTAHLDRVKEAVVFGDADRLYLALNRSAASDAATFGVVSNGLRTLRLDGVLYAFDRQAKGEGVESVLWWDEDLAGQLLILDQFDDLPLMLTVGAQNAPPQGGRTVRVAALDRRTGKMVYDREVPQSHNPFKSVRSDPRAGQIDLCRDDLTVRFALEATASARATP